MNNDTFTLEKVEQAYLLMITKPNNTDFKAANDYLIEFKVEYTLNLEKPIIVEYLLAAS